MSTLLPTMTSYVPPTLVQSVLGHPEAAAGPVCERIAGAILFADVSQFTHLTERFASRSAEGPEELSHLLNRFFVRMVVVIQSEGGQVVKFGGDAVTALFPASDEPLGHAARRAL